MTNTTDVTSLEMSKKLKEVGFDLPSVTYPSYWHEPHEVLHEATAPLLNEYSSFEDSDGPYTTTKGYALFDLIMFLKKKGVSFHLEDFKESFRCVYKGYRPKQGIELTPQDAIASIIVQVLQSE